MVNSKVKNKQSLWVNIFTLFSIAEENHVMALYVFFLIIKSSFIAYQNNDFTQSLPVRP